MTLKEYKAKRKSSSPEPKAGKSSKGKTLNFCVQKHDASHLHYDFRLEHKGVLLSWAVPKGPPMEQQEKHLAIKVEDHPLDYQYFEGTIPPGNYGAGTVEIWDHGTFILPHSDDSKEIEKLLEQELVKGHIAIILQGKKLKGEYVLQKFNTPKQENAWLMIKGSSSKKLMKPPISESKKKS
jgi:bifunctional non-homologous end joining protein LigD